MDSPRGYWDSNRGFWMAVLIGAGACILAVNAWWSRELPPDPLEKIEALESAGEQARAHPVYQQLLEVTPLDLELNYRFVNNFFDIRGNEEHADSLRVRYRKLAATPDGADLAHYCLGLTYVHTKDYEQALDSYARVKNRSLKYLNNSIGYVQLEMQQYDDAERALLREIEHAGNVPGAVHNLVDLYFQQDRLAEIDALIADDELQRFVSSSARRMLAFRNRDAGTYLALTLGVPFRDMNLESALVSLAICLMWFVYFWRIDIFEQEPVRFTLLAVLGGMTSVYVTTVLSDVARVLSPLELHDHAATEFAFWVLHVGLVEELSKFIPVMVIAGLSSQVNEPIDLIIYGSMSALGFATLENAMYFSDYGLGIVALRFLMSTTGHLVLTSLICFAWAWTRFVRQERSAPLVVLALLAAAILHGLYNFVLSADLGQPVVMFLVLCELALLNIMIRRCIEHSPFAGRTADRSRLSNAHLIAATGLGLILVAFLYENFTLSTEIANDGLLSLLGLPVIVGIFQLRTIGRIQPWSTTR